MCSCILNGQEHVSGKDGHGNGDRNSGDVAGDSSIIETKRRAGQQRYHMHRSNNNVGVLPCRERPSILLHKLLERLHERQIRFEHSKNQSQW